VINLKINNKKNKFINILIGIISLAIVVLLCTFLLDATGKINQGSFRVNDLVISSTVAIVDNEVKKETTDTTQKTEFSLSDLRLDVTQKNEISFLIVKTSDSEIADIYIDNIKTNYPVLTENMFIYQKEDNKIDLKTENIKLTLNKEDKDGQYLIKINIDNSNCIKGAVIPEATTSIVYDGTVFKVLNTKISDIVFDIEFNLNITDSNGRTNICKTKLYLPSELLVTNGISIIKEVPGNFPFRIK
jgi:hypothetical protein